MSWFRKVARELDPSRAVKSAERAVRSTAKSAAGSAMSSIRRVGDQIMRSYDQAEAEIGRGKDSVVAAYHDARNDIMAESERGTVNSLLISGPLGGGSVGAPLSPFSDLAFDMEAARHKEGIKKMEGAFDQDTPDPPPILPEAASLSKQVPLGALSDTGRAGLGSGSLLSSIRPTRGGAGRTYLV